MVCRDLNELKRLEKLIRFCSVCWVESDKKLQLILVGTVNFVRDLRVYILPVNSVVL